MFVVFIIDVSILISSEQSWEMSECSFGVRKSVRNKSSSQYSVSDASLRAIEFLLIKSLVL